MFLDPTNALFTDVQGRFLKKQTELYGTDHLYAADPFNEITPPSWEPNQRQRLPAAHRGRMGICLPCARWWNPYYLSLVFYSTVLDYFLVTLMERCPREGANVDVVSRLIRLRFDDPVLKRAFLGAALAAFGILGLALFGPATLRPALIGLSVLVLLTISTSATFRGRGTSRGLRPSCAFSRS